ncbi:MAG: hypothetical protein EXS05_16220 [Planctomycetaceae bacterium]|nr:hypothetical protein [Planctomycetaceae bacterium]
MANFDFWTAEVKHCLCVIDGYHDRFEKMKAAQLKHVALHDVVEFALDDRSGTFQSANQLKCIPDGELKNARRTLCDSFYRIIVRCYNTHLMDKDELERAATEVAIGIEASDLKH